MAAIEVGKKVVVIKGSNTGKTGVIKNVLDEHFIEVDLGGKVKKLNVRHVEVVG